MTQHNAILFALCCLFSGSALVADEPFSDPGIREVLSTQKWETVHELLVSFRNGNIAPENLQVALIEIENCVELLPDKVEFWMTRGWLWGLLTSNEEAKTKTLQSYIRAVDLDPGYLPAQLALCWSLMIQERYWSAIEQIEFLLHDDPSLAEGELIALLAYAYLLDRRVEAGLNSLKELGEQVGEKPEILLAVAVLERASGGEVEAMETLQSLLESGESESHSMIYARSLLQRWRERE